MVDEFGSGFHAALKYGRLEPDRLRRELDRLINKNHNLKATNVSFLMHFRTPKTPKNWAETNLRD
jgi:hypothetical protein